MTGLLQKLVLTGNAEQKILTTALMEQALPRSENNVIIVYRIETAMKPLNTSSDLQRRYAYQLADGNKRLWILAGVLEEQFLSPTPARVTNGQKLEKEFLFVTDNECVFTFGIGAASSVGIPRAANVGLPFPFGLKDNANVNRRVAESYGGGFNRVYDTENNPVIPGGTPSVTNKTGFQDNQTQLINENDGYQYQHQVFYLDVKMSLKELEKWVLNYG